MKKLLYLIIFSTPFLMQAMHNTNQTYLSYQDIASVLNAWKRAKIEMMPKPEKNIGTLKFNKGSNEAFFGNDEPLNTDGFLQTMAPTESYVSENSVSQESGPEEAFVVRRQPNSARNAYFNK